MRFCSDSQAFSYCRADSSSFLSQNFDPHSLNFYWLRHLRDHLYNINMMNEEITHILKQLRSDLESVIGDQLEALYLYGSQARGDARPDLDIDVLVVLRGNFQYFDMVQRTGEVAANLSLAYDTVISLAFVSSEKFEKQKIPFFLNV